MTTDSTRDQHEHWSGVYRRNRDIREHGSGFAAECLARISPESRLLELGCGTGADAATFAEAGHSVTATDFVEPAIFANRQRHGHVPNLNLRTMRMDEPFPFPDRAFNAVYAHLSLHYFAHDITVGIIQEIRRVLGDVGLLMFACKSPADPLYGKGVEIEPDMFDLNGHVRHFFREDYVRSLLARAFTDIEVASYQGNLYGGLSAWVTVFARAA